MQRPEKSDIEDRAMSDASDDHPAQLADSEDECAVCGGWPESLRAVMRSALTQMPLTGKLCEDCLMTWFRNIIDQHR